MVSTFISYGLKASLISGDASDFSVFTDGDLELLEWPPFSMEPADETEDDDDDEDFLFFSDGETRDLTVIFPESAPIWLHVCAKSASGLFLASNCKVKEKKTVLIS